MAAQRASVVRTITVAVIGQTLLLVALAATTGLGPAGWLAGIAFTAVGAAVLAAAPRRFGVPGFGPADQVTLTRAVLVGGVTAVVADTVRHPAPLPVLIALTAVALALDAVDGQVARRTGTASAFGARFDMEVDAFLILVLSAFAATTVGGWALAIGLMRYGFLAAGRALPWLRAAVAPSMLRKTVAAVQGTALVVVASGVLPQAVAIVVIALALEALTWSFARDVWWLYRRRNIEPGTDPEARPVRAPRTRRVVTTVISALAGVLVFVGLVVPNQLATLSFWSFLRIPVEGLVAVAVVLVVPTRARRPVAAVVGALLGLVTIVKVLDMGFFSELDRPFDPLYDWSFFAPAVEFLQTSAGKAGAVAAAIAAVVLATAVVTLTTLAAMRLSRVVTSNRKTSTRVVAVLGVIWIASAVLGVQIAPSQPVAASSTAKLVYDDVRQVATDLNDRAPFRRSIGVDAFAGVPGDDLLTGLRGKDVLFTFVESYGRVAVQDSPVAPQVDAALDAGTKRLRADGFAARSAFLTSSTFGGGSWLAHSTLQSGLWVNNQQRYNDLIETNRLTLASAFKRAGWRTVVDLPANTRDWADGGFYGYQQVYDSRNVGYRGPKFAYATMPDQYTMSALQRTELARSGDAPVMAEVDLVTSHNPWTPLPQLVNWKAVGDGSIFGPMPAAGESKDYVWSDPNRIKAAYGQSIQYSLNALISYVETYGDNNLVLVFLGDHQPGPAVAGDGANRDVPVTIVARDPAVLDRIASWEWQDGLRPGANAPVWRMDTFRDRFLTAYGPQNPRPRTPAMGIAH